jgi:hypothetical protein
LSKSCQKVVKKGKKSCQKISSHLVKPKKSELCGEDELEEGGAIVEKVQWGNSKKANWWNNKNKNRIVW